jgi:hypothetical protein
MGKTRVLFAAAAVSLAVLACQQPLDIGSFSTAGTWKGTLKVPVAAPDTATFVFEMDLQQNRRSVSGTADVISDGDTVNTDVSGQWAYPAVAMHLTAPDFAALDFAATFVGRDTLRGPINSSGFPANTQLTIVRQ